MKKPKSLILHEAKQLRQEYYYYKQRLANFKTLFSQFEDRILKDYFEGEGVENCDYSTYYDGLSIIKRESDYLAQLKTELDKLPHIPNKQERKEIRKLKQKANVNKQS